MSNKEIRTLELEIRVEQEEDGVAYIEGYPIVFNQETVVGDRFREMIVPEAVTETLLKDIPLLEGHKFDGTPLARSRNNNANSTMQLNIDDHGVHMRAALDIRNNPKAKEVYSAIKRGDVSGMSFAFVANKESWDDLNTDLPLRTITGFERVYEVSVVTFPAYEGTSIQAASEGEALESVLASLESARKQAEEERAAAEEAERAKAAEEAEKERRRVVLEQLRYLIGG